MRYDGGMLNEHSELITYLGYAIEKLRGLTSEAYLRNKTKKVKAILSILTVVEGRILATLQYAKAGGFSSNTSSVVIQKHLYDPMIDWLGTELRK